MIYTAMRYVLGENEEKRKNQIYSQAKELQTYKSTQILRTVTPETDH